MINSDPSAMATQTQELNHFGMDITKSLINPKSSPSPPPNAQTTYFYNKQLLQTGLFADCTIVCNTRTGLSRTLSKSSTSFACHRNILSPRCAFFRCCLDGRFEEAGTKVIRMDDDDPIAVEAMLHYLYTLEYPTEVCERLMVIPDWSSGFKSLGRAGGSDSGIEDDDDGISASGKGRETQVYWGFDLLVFGVAEKYGLEELRDMAGRALLEKAVGLTKVKKEGDLLIDMDGFVGLMESLYASDMSEPGLVLRSQIIKTTCQVMAAHIRRERVAQLVADVPEFAVELVEMLGRREEERKIVKKEEDRKIERERSRMRHVPMNEDSDGEE